MAQLYDQSLTADTLNSWNVSIDSILALETFHLRLLLIYFSRTLAQTERRHALINVSPYFRALRSSFEIREHSTAFYGTTEE